MTSVDIYCTIPIIANTNILNLQFQSRAGNRARPRRASAAEGQAAGNSSTDSSTSSEDEEDGQGGPGHRLQCSPS